MSAEKTARGRHWEDLRVTAVPAPPMEFMPFGDADVQLSALASAAASAGTASPVFRIAGEVASNSAVTLSPATLREVAAVGGTLELAPSTPREPDSEDWLFG